MKVNYFLLLIFCFYLLGCEAKPGQKEIPTLKKKTISQVVEDHHNPKVDILFIIDNSSSMKPYQERLKMNASVFVNYFLNVGFIDYHIGVTNSSVYNVYSGNSSFHFLGPISPFYNHSLYTGGMLVGSVSEQDGSKYHYVDNMTPRGGQLLSDMMSVGIKGNGEESFLSVPRITFSSKRYEAQNNGFLRPKAHLAIFVITDTDDQSGILPQQAYEYLLNLKGGDDRKLHYAAALVFTDRENCEFDYVYGKSVNLITTPDLLMEMVELFGDRGYFFDLCKFNYGEDLAHIARSIVFSILTINLDDLPDISSIRVCYRDDISKEREFCEKGQEIFSGPDGWSYDIEKNTVNLSPNVLLESKLNGRFDIQFNPIYSPDSGQ